MTDQVAVNLIQAIATLAGLVVTTLIGYMVRRLDTKSEARADKAEVETVQVRTDLLNANAENYHKIDALAVQARATHNLVVQLVADAESKL